MTCIILVFIVTLVSNFLTLVYHVAPPSMSRVRRRNKRSQSLPDMMNASEELTCEALTKAIADDLAKILLWEKIEQTHIYLSFNPPPPPNVKILDFASRRVKKVTGATVQWRWDERTAQMCAIAIINPK